MSESKDNAELDALRRQEEKAVRGKMLIAGFIVAALGLFALLLIIVNFLMLIRGDLVSVNVGPFGGELESAGVKAFCLAGVGLYFGSIAIAGIGFLKRREWARKLVLTILWLSAAINLLAVYVTATDMTAAEEFGPDGAVVSTVVAAGLGFLIIWFVARFFTSPDAKAWCAAPMAKTPWPPHPDSREEAIEALKSRAARRMKTVGLVTAFIGLGACIPAFLAPASLYADDPGNFSLSPGGLFSQWHGWVFAAAWIVQFCLGIPLGVAGVGFYLRLKWARRLLRTVLLLAMACLPILGLVLAAGVAITENVFLGLFAGVFQVLCSMFWIWILRMTRRYFDSPAARAWCAEA